ncbi:MAG: PEGA domain-containing protein [Xanthomonadales bacterium]|nr:PEGA domain-containing protein [Xanthomonadales bacterium]
MSARRLKLSVATMVIACAAGCITTKPFVSKKTHGNLQVQVEWAVEQPPPTPAEVTVDGRPMGNVSPHRPVLYLREGRHVVEVSAEGFVPVRKEVHVAGEPNRQYLHILMREE